MKLLFPLQVHAALQRNVWKANPKCIVTIGSSVPKNLARKKFYQNLSSKTAPGIPEFKSLPDVEHTLFHSRAGIFICQQFN
jgi:hypothetical protein